jgi:hypothetical protein
MSHTYNRTPSSMAAASMLERILSALVQSSSAMTDSSSFRAVSSLDGRPPQLGRAPAGRAPLVIRPFLST